MSLLRRLPWSPILTWLSGATAGTGLVYTSTGFQILGACMFTASTIGILAAAVTR